MPFSIPVFYGSVRDNRQGIKAARFVVNKLEEKGFEPLLIDPLEYDLPLLRKMYKSYKDESPPQILKDLAAIIQNADGFVIVTGEYNHTIPPALSNLMDHFLEEYFHRPAGIVSYSKRRISGARAAMHVRVMLGELGMTVIPTEFAIPKVQDSFQPDGTPTDENMHRYVEQFLNELKWHVQVMKDGRSKYELPY